MTELALLTVPQAAKRLMVSPSAVIRAIRRGDLKAIKVKVQGVAGPPRWRIEPAELQRYNLCRVKDYSDPPENCSKCGGPRTWPEHAYCQECNNAYRKAWRERRKADSG